MEIWGLMLDELLAFNTLKPRVPCCQVGTLRAACILERELTLATRANRGADLCFGTFNINFILRVLRKCFEVNPKSVTRPYSDFQNNEYFTIQD